MSPDPRESRLAARLGQRFVRAYTSSFHHLTASSPCPVPADGPAILVCNHTSGLDPVFLQATCNRVITWMMAREYFEIAPLKPFFKSIEAIPVARSGRDSAAARQALKELEIGRVLGVFPEGRIEPTRDLLPFQPGVAMLAIKGNAPVYPAFLDGSQRGKGIGESYGSPVYATLTFGPPLKLTREHSLEEGTKLIEAAVRKLMN